MERITLGKTGLTAHRLGFGGIPIQRATEEQAVATVARFLETGLDFVDTSRAYTTSERRIGLAVRQTGIRPIIASKSHTLDGEGARADLATSLSELDVDFIDLYQCHFVKDMAAYEQAVGPGGALEAFKEARAEGLIGHIGLTSHNLDVLARVVEEELFETIMVCYGILEPKAGEEIIPRALEKGIGVMTMKPLGGGWLDDPNLGIKFNLSRPGVMVLAGMEHPDLVDQNFGIYEQGEWALSPAEQEAVAAIQQEFDKKFCRRCDYCQPCPQEIPIQVMMGLPSMYKRMGIETLLEEGRQTALANAENCTECGECMTRCPYELPIPDLVKERLDWAKNMIAEHSRS